MPNSASPQFEVPPRQNWGATNQDVINTRRFGAPQVQGQPFADPALGFAAAVNQRVNGALVRCEERYPSEGHHSVLYVVVNGEAPHWREQLRPLHQEYFGPAEADPLAPVRLEVVDRATDEALQRLVDAGLLAKSSRATRPLWSLDGLQSGSAPLSPDELAKLASYRKLAVRKLKMARVVAEAGLEEDARTPLLDCILALSRAQAVEQRLPEPRLVNEALLPPLSPSWKEALPLLRQFSLNAAHPRRPVLEALRAFVPNE